MLGNTLSNSPKASIEMSQATSSTPHITKARIDVGAYTIRLWDLCCSFASVARENPSLLKHLHSTPWRIPSFGCVSDVLLELCSLRLVSIWASAVISRPTTPQLKPRKAPVMLMIMMRRIIDDGVMPQRQSQNPET